MNVLKVIPNTGGDYFITTHGEVFTRARKGNKGGLLRQHLNGTGYLCVTLRIAGKKKKGLIHHLLALTFLPNPDNKPCVNHKDGNKLNNSIENLEWCTYSENMKHAISTGLNKVPALSGEKHPMRKLTANQVKQIRLLYSEKVPPPSLAKTYNVTKEQIYNIVKGKHWRNI